jgi:hypothetical protein
MAQRLNLSFTEVRNGALAVPPVQNYAWGKTTQSPGNGLMALAALLASPRCAVSDFKAGRSKASSCAAAC